MYFHRLAIGPVYCDVFIQHQILNLYGGNFYCQTSDNQLLFMVLICVLISIKEFFAPKYN